MLVFFFLLLLFLRFFFFFFQAEDGIRDHCVTGVQTCALPISDGAGLAHPASVAPAAADEGPARSGPFDHEHSAVQVPEEPPDLQFAVDAGARPAAGDAQRARTAGDAPPFDGQRLDGADAEGSADFVHLALCERTPPAYLVGIGETGRRAIAGKGVQVDEAGDEPFSHTVAEGPHSGSE